MWQKKKHWPRKTSFDLYKMLGKNIEKHVNDPKWMVKNGMGSNPYKNHQQTPPQRMKPFRDFPSKTTVFHPPEKKGGAIHESRKPTQKIAFGPPYRPPSITTKKNTMKKHPYCWLEEIRRSPVEVASLSTNIYKVLAPNKRWLAGFPNRQPYNP